MIRHFIALIFLCLSPLAWAQFGASAKSQFRANSSATTIAPGEPFQIALTLIHPAGHHSYYENPGSVGASLKVSWKLPDDFSVSNPSYPIPHVSKKKQGDETVLSYGYKGTVHYLFTLTPPADLAPGDVIVKGSANWLICNDTGCFPEQESFEISLLAGAQPITNTSSQDIIAKAKAHYPAEATGWSVKIEDAEEDVYLKLEAPKSVSLNEPFYFYSADGQVDAQAEQLIEHDGQKIELFLARNQGNEDLGIAAVPAQETLPGIFVYHTAEGKEAAIKIGGNSSPVASEHAAKTAKATPEEIAKGRELYDAAGPPNIVDLDGKQEKEVTFLSSLGLVFLGGLLLNLMPCVFPVLGIKVMGFVSQAGEDESKIKKHGLVFGLGLLITMWILAAVIISLKLNWGEQLSNPIFLGAIIILLFLMGLNLYGVFEFGTSMTGVGGELQAKKGYSGSFFQGALTTLIATPCSGPFLGAVMGFALAQDSKFVSFSIFTVFALGIASPYILLSFFPALIKKLPRPGAWMESFKQIMSFLVFATVVFFMKSFLKLVGDEHFNLFLFALTLIGLGVYIYGRWGHLGTPAGKRKLIGYGLAGVFTFGGLAWAYSTAKPPKEHEIVWNEWYPGSMELARSKKRIVWVDYTADW